MLFMFTGEGYKRCLYLVIRAFYLHLLMKSVVCFCLHIVLYFLSLV